MYTKTIHIILYSVVNAAFIDAMAEFLIDEPELIKQTFEEPLDYRNVSNFQEVVFSSIFIFWNKCSFDYDDEDAFEKWMAAQS